MYNKAFQRENCYSDNAHNKLDCRRGVEYNLQNFQPIFVLQFIFKTKEKFKTKTKMKRTKILKISGGLFDPPKRFLSRTFQVKILGCLQKNEEQKLTISC